MDRIDRACREAKKLGLSYGKYKALIYEQQQKEGYTPKAKTVKKIEEVKPRICVVCGKEIPPDSRRRKYCCQECYEITAGHISRAAKKHKGK